MDTQAPPPRGKSAVDMQKFRLRRFVERLIDMGEVDIHDEPLPLTALNNAEGRTVMATTETEANGSGNTRFLGSSEGNALLSEVGSRPADAQLPPDPGGVLRRVNFSVGGLKTFAVASAAEWH